MARSFSNVKSFSVLLVNEASVALNRRGYAAASQGAATTPAKVAAPKNNVIPKTTAEETAASSWTPDPKTGYYRPENVADEIDVAELRQILLKQRS